MLFRSILNKIDEFTAGNAELANALRDIHNPVKSLYAETERKLTLRPEGLFGKINNYRILTTTARELTETEKNQVNEASLLIDQAVELMKTFLEKEWPAYISKIKEKTVPLGVVIKL